MNWMNPVDITNLSHPLNPANPVGLAIYSRHASKASNCAASNDGV